MDRRKNPTSQVTVGRAKRLRREATYPERILWMRLRAAQLHGLRFRRQHAVGPYILDFYCRAASLAIELDGFSHDDQAKYDAQRTAFLEANGIRVIRVSNDEVLKNIENVLHVIACECGLEV